MTLTTNSKTIYNNQWYVFWSGRMTVVIVLCYSLLLILGMTGVLPSEASPGPAAFTGITLNSTSLPVSRSGISASVSSGATWPTLIRANTQFTGWLVGWWLVYLAHLDKGKHTVYRRMVCLAHLVRANTQFTGWLVGWWFVCLAHLDKGKHTGWFTTWPTLIRANTQFTGWLLGWWLVYLAHLDKGKHTVYRMVARLVVRLPGPP